MLRSFVQGSHSRRPISLGVRGVLSIVSQLQRVTNVFQFAPPSAQKFLSYLIGIVWLTHLTLFKADGLLGWLCVLGWQAATGSASFLAGTEIQGLVVLNNPGYIYQRWHGTLLTIAVVAFCSVFNTSLAKRLPLVEGLVLILHILGFFAIMIPLWVFAPRSEASAVFTEFHDGGNWGSTGLASLVGILAPVVSLLGSDASTHMSEELKNASKTLPIAMISTIAFNGALGLVMLITFCFCLGDIDSILATPTGYPFIQVFYNATLSTGGATAMTSIMIVLALFAAVTNMATASRQLFAFARDHGVPFSGFFCRVSFFRPRMISCPL
jgi:choline transport protein